MPRFREEVVNVQLAEALIARGFDAHPETVTRKKQLPDVIINLGGLKLIIEGRVKTALKSLKKDAADRVEEGLADISIAIGYAEGLTSASGLRALQAKIEQGRYSGFLYAYAGGRLRADEFQDLSLDELADLINACFRMAVQNDVVREQVRRVEWMIEGIVETAIQSDLFVASEVLTGRLRSALGIDDAKSQTKEGD